MFCIFVGFARPSYIKEIQIFPLREKNHLHTAQDLYDSFTGKQKLFETLTVALLLVGLLILTGVSFETN